MPVQGIIAKKVGMTQVYGKDGRAIPVTVLTAGPCVVVERKTTAKHGYSAVQVGFVEDKRVKHTTKPMQGHFKKAGVPPTRMTREFRVPEADAINPGDKVNVSLFGLGEKVSVTGTSKGKGFAGVVKRHHFRGGDGTHGSMHHRAPGGIGASAFPSRVIKGLRAAGHMGTDTVTTKNIQVVEIDEENNLLVVRGAVPGAISSYVIVNKAGSRRTGK
ncbi:MAG: 50S ribosomal protein L3 [Vicinamibacteria bacterium]|nr:50S ribosomal protein L3 [Vicinamibacteria bacterium]